MNISDFVVDQLISPVNFIELRCLASGSIRSSCMKSPKNIAFNSKDS